MPSAVWKGTIIAEAPADTVETVEGNVYFPIASVRQDLLSLSETRTECPWKGTASYYDVEVDGQVNHDAAWYYADPKPAAHQVRGRIAFWRGIEVRTQ